MTRRSILLAVMLSVLLQAVAMGGLWSTGVATGEAFRTLLQLTGGAEHPDRLAAERPVSIEMAPKELACVDEGMPQDAAADLYYHLGIDAWLHVLGLIPVGIRSVTDPAAGPPPELLAEAASPEPVLEGPRRPPRRLG